MDYWHFSSEEKDELIEKLTIALPILRATTKPTRTSCQCKRDIKTDLLRS